MNENRMKKQLRAMAEMIASLDDGRIPESQVAEALNSVFSPEELEDMGLGQYAEDYPEYVEMYGGIQ